MRRLILWLTIAAAVSIGGLNVFAAGGSRPVLETGPQVSVEQAPGEKEKVKPTSAAAEEDEDAASEVTGPGDESDDQDEDDEAAEDESKSASLKEEKVKEPKPVKGAAPGADASAACSEDRLTHGCAVSTAVHDALLATEADAGRGVAVSTAAHQADCTMLPEPAQAACAKKAAWEHPNADGIPGNKPDPVLSSGSGGGGPPAHAVEKSNNKAGKKK
jgi:hypothetical protein